jgi:hypothetical protein
MLITTDSVVTLVVNILLTEDYNHIFSYKQFTKTVPNWSPQQIPLSWQEIASEFYNLAIDGCDNYTFYSTDINKLQDNVPFEKINSD